MQITNAEWKIMELLWNESPRTITEMTKMLKDDTGWTKQTIITMLQRMTEKNKIRFGEGRKAKFFYPVITKEEAEAAETNALLEKAFNGSPSLLISAMVKNQKISKDALDEICNILGVTHIKD